MPAVSEVLTNTKVMAIITQFNSTTTKKYMLLEECKNMKPYLLLGVIPTVPALPLSRSLRIQLEL
eukprot:670929-Prorocentrum_lima.AAC.1